MNRKLLSLLIFTLPLAILVIPFWLTAATQPESSEISRQIASSGCNSVSGNILVDTTWLTCTIVTGSVIVEQGVALTITPGSTVFFDPEVLLRVEGKLIASGYPTATITFTSNDSSPAPGDWAYIYFTSTSTNNSGCNNTGSLMQHTIVEYAGGATISDNGAIRIQGSAPCIENNIIRYNNADGIHAWSAAFPHDIFPTINNNQIIDNGIPGITEAAGIYFRSPGLSQTVLFSFNDIERNTNTGIIIDVSTNALITLQQNTIIDNTSTSSSGGGINFNARSSNIFQNIIVNNSTAQNGGGIYFANGQNNVFVVSNVIANNQALHGGGFYLCDGCRPIINNNDFCLNTDSFDNDFYNNNDSSEPTINTQNNYWVELELPAVESHVFHQVDLSSLGLVDYNNIKLNPSNVIYCPLPPTRTPTPTNTPTLTPTPTNTNTPTDTPTFTNTPTDTPTFTNTPTNTPTETNTPTITSTTTRTPTTTDTPTTTPTPSRTPSPTITPTPTNTLTPSPTPTNLPPPLPAPVYLPIALRPSPFFKGDCEKEDNGTSSTANGLLELSPTGTTYCGFANVDRGEFDRDFFKIDVTDPGLLTIDVTNHPLGSVFGAQLQLYYLTADKNGFIAVDVTPDYSISYEVSLDITGIYYIYIFNDVNKCSQAGVDCNQPYTLTLFFEP